MRAKLLQSCPTLCNPMDSGPPGSSVHGILQARILENPRDGGAWWAAVYGMAQSRTPLKRLSSCIVYYMAQLSVRFLYNYKR